MKKLLLAVVILFVLYSSAFALPQPVLINTQDRAKIRDLIVLGASNNPANRLISTSEYQVVTERDFEGIGAFLLMDVRTLRPPVMRTTFNIIPLESGMIRVTVNYVAISNPGTNQEMHTRTDAPYYDKTLQSFLYQLKSKADGTPIEELMVQQPPSQKEQKIAVTSGLNMDNNTIKSLSPQSLAANAGLKEGDLILEINGKATTDNIAEEINSKLSLGRSVMITYERNGNKDITTLKAK